MVDKLLEGRKERVINTDGNNRGVVVNSFYSHGVFAEEKHVNLHFLFIKQYSNQQAGFMKNNIATFMQLLRDAGYTQDEIASKIGVSNPTINKFMSGKIVPSIQTLIKIADAFGVTTDAVLGREPAKVAENIKRPWERKKATCENSILMS